MTLFILRRIRNYRCYYYYYYYYYKIGYNLAFLRGKSNIFLLSYGFLGLANLMVSFKLARNPVAIIMKISVLEHRRL